MNKIAPALPLTAVEYFAGIGLVKMGLEVTGWEMVFANDFSEKKHQMYRDFFPNEKAPYLVEDIFKLEADLIPRATLATCSFPCIDLSLAGNMNGILNGAHSSAFWGFLNILKAQGVNAPEIIMLENVPGWLYSNKGKDFEITVQALNSLGYSCDVFTLNAQSFTPQSRQRVFLIGTKLPVAHRTAEFILSRSKALLPDRLRQNIVANKDLDWFYNPIPEPPKLMTEGLATIVEQIPSDDDRWWSEAETSRHLNMMTEEHRARVLELSNNTHISYRAFFRRKRGTKQRAEVRNDELSGCLRTAIGGSGKQFLIAAGNNGIKMRAMTPREYARLQGVEDRYPIAVKTVQALTGFGDAVCVPVISWIATNVLNPLASGRSVDTFYEMPVTQHFLLEGND